MFFDDPSTANVVIDPDVLEVNAIPCDYTVELLYEKRFNTLVFVRFREVLLPGVIYSGALHEIGADTVYRKHYLRFMLRPYHKDRQEQRRANVSS